MTESEAVIERPRFVQLDLRDLPGEVQDMLRERAIREGRPVAMVVADYVVETARMIVRTAERGAA